MYLVMSIASAAGAQQKP